MSRVIVAVSLVCLVIVLVACDNIAAEGALARSPYLQNVTQNRVDVMWGNSADTGTLHWGTSPGSYTNTVASSAFLDSGGTNYVHTATVTGLNPGQTVYYYVNSGSDTIGQGDDSYHATTAPAGNASFRFIAYGDSRSYPIDHTRVINRMVPHDPDIVLHMGDIVNSGFLSQYNDWYFAPTAPLAKNTSVFPTIGNHELYGDPTAANYHDVYSLPTNGDGTEDYYSFDYGSVHFVSLDSELLPTGVAGHGNSGRAAAQKAWLEADLDATTNPWTVVYFHRPVYWDSDIDSAWRATFEDKEVDLVLAGHVHNYDSHYRNGVYYITTGGGGAEMHVPGTLWPNYRLATFADYHFTQIDATPESLDINVYDDDDVLRHSFSISIPEPSTVVLLGLGGLGLLVRQFRRRRRKRKV